MEAGVTGGGTLLQRVQDLLSPKVSPEHASRFFEKHGVRDLEDLSVMMDEVSWVEIGLQKAQARVAITRIQKHIRN